MRYLLFLSCLITSLGFAQGNRKFISNGDSEFEKGQYASAIYYYNQIFHPSAGEIDAAYNPYAITSYAKEPKGNLDSIQIAVPTEVKSNQIPVVHKIAYSHALAKDYGKAEEWYALAVKNPSEDYPFSPFEYGNVLLANGKYDEAIVVYEEFAKLFGPESDMLLKVNSKIASCQFAKRNEQVKGVNVALANDKLNTGSTSFGINGMNGTYLFTSARKDSSVVGSNHFLTNVYAAQKTAEGDFFNIKALPEVINSKQNEGAAAISPNGKQIVFTRKSVEDVSTMLFESKKVNGEWTAPVPMGITVNAKGFSASAPSFAPDGKTLFYTSNKPGGEGGMDIWQVSIDADGNLSEPRNMGLFVNTSFDEMSPYFHQASKTLYFSSLGHIGMGGFDVFQSTINPNTDWYGAAKNLGKPINSSRDESYFSMDSLLREGYVTSDRELCTDCNETSLVKAYCNKIYTIKKDEIVITLSGYVFDKDSEARLVNAKVQIKDIRGAIAPVVIMTDKNGFYKTTLKVNEEYILKGTMKDYFADGGVENTIALDQSTDLEHDLFLALIPKGEIAIKGIEYDYNKATLRPSSIVELDKLVKFLELNDNLSVQIRSHTDARGSDVYNLSLSQGRAKSVVDYLISKGIDPKKLLATGMGETEPAIIKGPDGKDLTLLEAMINALPNAALKEEYHQRNRRTALKVLAE